MRARHNSFLEQTLQLRGQSFLYVNLLQARGLNGGDSKSSSARNPYAVLSLGASAKVYSTTMYKTLNPVWDEDTSL